MFRSRLFLFLLLISLPGTLARPAAAVEEINKSFLGGIALGGYDAVSYFTEGKALKGDKDYAFD